MALKEINMLLHQRLILGSKDELDFEVKQAYATAGAMHVLAVSGLHVGIIFLILNTLLTILDTSKKGRIVKAIILLISLWMLCFDNWVKPIRFESRYDVFVCNNGNCIE